MKTHVRELLNDRIGVLDRNVVDISSARQAFRTMSAILVLVRVSALAPPPLVDSHWLPNKDKAINNKDCVQLSEHCFDVCMALETVIRGKSCSICMYAFASNH